MQIILSVITEAVCSFETVVPKYNTIYNSEEHYINTHRHENLKRKIAINCIKFLNRMRIICYTAGERVTFFFKCSRISTRCRSPLTTEATCLIVTSAPTCLVFKLKWKIEVLTVITMKIPALWNGKSCSLWTCTSEKSLQCTCQNKLDHIYRRDNLYDWSCRVNIIR
jgi:hypothetical protein